MRDETAVESVQALLQAEQHQALASLLREGVDEPVNVVGELQHIQLGVAVPLVGHLNHQPHVAVLRVVQQARGRGQQTHSRVRDQVARAEHDAVLLVKVLLLDAVLHPVGARLGHGRENVAQVQQSSHGRPSGRALLRLRRLERHPRVHQRLLGRLEQREAHFAQMRLLVVHVKHEGFDFRVVEAHPHERCPFGRSGRQRCCLAEHFALHARLADDL